MEMDMAEIKSAATVPLNSDFCFTLIPWYSCAHAKNYEPEGKPRLP